MQPIAAPQNLSDALYRGTRWNRLRSAVRRLSRPLRASEQHVRTVWVIVTAPEYEGSLIGVMHTGSWRKADSIYSGAVADSIELVERHGRGEHADTLGRGLHVWLMPLRTAATGDALGAEILILLGQDRSDWPVAREYHP